MNDYQSPENSNNYTTFQAQQSYNSINTQLYYTDKSLKEYKLYVAPKPNWKIYFGDTKDAYIYFYIKTPPSKIARWFYKKILGINWVKIEELNE